MRNIHSKQDILESLRDERVLINRLIERVGPQHASMPGAMGKLTFKDLLAHLVAWCRREVSCAESIRRGETPMPHPSPAEVEIINNWIYFTQRDRSFEALVNDVDEVWRMFEAAINGIDERKLLQAGPPPRYDRGSLGERLLSDFVDHYHDDHEADVEAWLKEKGI